MEGNKLFSRGGYQCLVGFDDFQRILCFGSKAAGRFSRLPKESQLLECFLFYVF